VCLPAASKGCTGTSEDQTGLRNSISAYLAVQGTRALEFHSPLPLSLPLSLPLPLPGGMQPQSQAHASCCIDQLFASQYISAIPRIIKSGKYAEDIEGQPPTNAIRYYIMMYLLRSDCNCNYTCILHFILTFLSYVVSSCLVLSSLGFWLMG
jgi:hypothetical protein